MFSLPLNIEFSDKAIKKCRENERNVGGDNEL